MFGRFFFTCLVSIVLVILETGVSIAQHRSIEMELIADDRGQLGLQQEWMEALNNAGIDRVRIVTNRTGKRPSVEEVQVGESILIRLTGSINGRTLFLPGRKFGMNDTENISAYVRQLRDDGAAIALAEKKGFGLTSEQLVDVHTDLSAVVEVSTRGLSTGEVFDAVRGLIKIPIILDREVEALIRTRDETVKDELTGFSAGLAVATIIRPLGLVLVPGRLQGGEVQFRVVPSESAEEHWPIGWPIEEQVSKVEPKLFDRIDVDIRNFKLADALNAISGRIEVPVFYDQNSLARKMVDPATTVVTLVQPKLTYYSIIQKLCSQVRPALGLELRTDENGKPFFWVF